MPKQTVRWNPARGVWETTQTGICGHSVPFSGTWPTSGMTRDGSCFPLHTSALLTSARASSSSLTQPGPRPGLLATPDTIPDAPCVQANKSIVRKGEGKVQGLGNQLTRQVGQPSPHKLLPTPVVNDMGTGKTPTEWDDWNTGPTMAHQPHGPSLAIEVQRLLPTPTASMVEVERVSEKSGGPSLGAAVQRLLPTPKATNNDNATREDTSPNLGMTLTRLEGVPPKKRAKAKRGRKSRGESTPAQ